MSDRMPLAPLAILKSAKPRTIAMGNKHALPPEPGVLVSKMFPLAARMIIATIKANGVLPQPGNA